MVKNVGDDIVTIRHNLTHSETRRLQWSKTWEMTL